MTQKIKNLRRPIYTEVNGNPCVMLSIGYLAHALGRSTWTVKHFIRLGLLPEAPLILHPDTPNLRRRLYPASFISAMKIIGGKDYVADRLEREDWSRFHAEVLRAYEKTILPLLKPCVTEEMVSTVDTLETPGNTSSREHPSIAACASF